MLAHMVYMHTSASHQREQPSLDNTVSFLSTYILLLATWLRSLVCDPAYIAIKKLPNTAIIKNRAVPTQN